jgi:hypothetical protein
VVAIRERILHSESIEILDKDISNLKLLYSVFHAHKREAAGNQHTTPDLTEVPKVIKHFNCHTMWWLKLYT